MALLWEDQPPKNGKIQERALGFVYGDYDTTYHDLLHKAKLPTFELGRERSIAILTYKILHDQAPNYLKDLINCNRNSKLYHHTKALNME